MDRGELLRKLRRRVGRRMASVARRLDPPKVKPKATWVPTGHFYSPIPDADELDEQAFEDLAPKDLPDVNLNPEGQLATLDALGKLEAPHLYGRGDERSVRYETSSMFGQKSANALSFILRHLRPKRIVEVGSGFSSAVMLDTDDHFLGGTTKMTFVEPYPERLYGLLRDADKSRVTVHETTLQTVDRAPFEALEAGDVLFIDSSHVLKTGSDLVTLFFEILPALASGVYVHFHDVLYPFEYPWRWIEEGRSWNEAYALRLFLANNSAYELWFWASYLYRCHRDAIDRVPEVSADGSSIWIVKR